MNYDEFKQHLMKDLKGRLSGQYDSLVVDTLYVNKLQGESYDSISLQPHEGGIGASINATKLFHQYQAGTDYDAVLAIAEAIALDGLERLPSVDTDMFYDYASIKDKLTVELVPQEGNEHILDFTAQQTLDYTQSLYERKLVTYPRTDSHYLTDDMGNMIPELRKTVEDCFTHPVHSEMQFSRDSIDAWLREPVLGDLSQKYAQCFKEFCESKEWTVTTLRDARYVLMHTFAHLLIKQMSMSWENRSSNASYTRQQLPICTVSPGLRHQNVL